MRTVRVYSLSNFATYHVAVLTMVTVVYFTSSVLVYLITGSLCPLDTLLLSPLLLPTTSGNYKSDLFF